VASTLLDHDVVPVGWKKSCQNVLSGWLRSPIGSVTHVPALEWMEVASGMEIDGTPDVESPPAGALPSALTTTEANSTKGTTACTYALRPRRQRARVTTR
jgi:hypothetical protein